MAVPTHDWLIKQGKATAPDSPTNRVTAFCEWVFGLYHSQGDHVLSRQEGKKFEKDYSQYWDLEPFGKPTHSDLRLVFRDALDGSSKPFQISSLRVNGEPLRGIPDAVLCHQTSKQLIIFERKVTGSFPEAWPNLKAQLWCYGLIDDFLEYPEICLIGSIYNPDRPMNQSPTLVGYWTRFEPTFHRECLELFEVYGGRYVPQVSSI